MNSLSATQPVPGYDVLATNLMARTWNSVPGLITSKTLGEAKRMILTWAKTLPK